MCYVCIISASNRGVVLQVGDEVIRIIDFGGLFAVLAIALGRGAGVRLFFEGRCASVTPGF